MEYKRKKHNAPISSVIKQFLDKKGGKVVASRKEIVWRFDALDWKYQKQILSIFLQSGKTDRNWAYEKLYVCWDDCFVPTLQELWETYHETRLSWLVIRYFPVDYVKRNIEDLSGGRNYFYIYKRLCDDKGFIVDKTKLDEPDLLHVRREQLEIITDDDVRDLFFLLIYKLCKGRYNYSCWPAMDKETSLLTLFIHPKVKRLMLELSVDPRGIRLADELHEWMWKVTKEFTKSYNYIQPYKYYPYVGDMIKDFCYKHIDAGYTDVWNTYNLEDQHQFLAYLEERHKDNIQKEISASSAEESTEYIFPFVDNRSLNKLVEMFDLVQVDTPPF